MKKKVLSFVLALFITFNYSVNAYAFDAQQYVNELMLSGADMSNVLRLFIEQIGVIFNPDIWGTGAFYDLYSDYLSEKALIDSSMTYEEYILSHLTASENEAGEVSYSADSEMMNTIYNFTNYYIQEYCGWYECETMDYRNYPASDFNTQGHYNAFISYCTQNIKGTDKTCFIAGSWVKTVLDENGESYSVSYKRMSEPLEVEYYVWNTGGFENDSIKRAYITQNWQTYAPVYYQITENGNEGEDLTFTGVNTASFAYPNTPVPLTDGSRTVRVYKTLEDLKNYSVGQRSYYYTSKFHDYDLNNNNSCTISESDFSTNIYGDITNNVITIIENADGLTEDELRRILDEYFDDLKDDDSGDDDDSGGDDDDDSGGGLLDFLDGLGDFFDGILSILGKLLEYIGKAVTLVTDTLSSIVDIIPASVTGMLAATFPMLPEEWFSAIELALVLGVLGIVIKLLKG